MCGRFAFFSSSEVITAVFGLKNTPALKPRFNVAPGQQVFSVRSEGGKLMADQFRWGLVPFWAKDPKVGHQMINARAETVAEKPSYRQALRRRRCLIPADGFYEWQKAINGKQPWFISGSGGALLAFAGLWDEWRDADDTLLRTCTIITAVANEFMTEIHQRMPVIVSSDQYETWLDTEASSTDFERVLTAGSEVELQAWPVSRKVNNPINDQPELIEAVAG